MTDNQKQIATKLETLGFSPQQTVKIIHQHTQHKLLEALDSIDSDPSIKNPKAYLSAILRNNQKEERANQPYSKAPACHLCNDGLISFSISKFNLSYDRVAACSCPRGLQRQQPKYGNSRMKPYNSLSQSHQPTPLTDTLPF